MNKRRRAILHKMLDNIERLMETEMDKATALGILKEALNVVEENMNEEEASIDSLPEGLKWSSRTLNMQDNLSDLTDIFGDLECVVEACEKMTEFDYSVIKKDIVNIVNMTDTVIRR